VFEARCAADNRFGLRPLAEVEHRNPSLGCGCGIHASASPRDLMTSTPSLPALSVVGTVSMWGHTIEHQRAWRSQFAYPARLTLVCAECLRSGAGGGRPVAVALGVYGRSTRESLVAMCDAHRRLAAGGSFPMIDVAEVQGALLDRYAVDPLPQEAVRMLVARRLDAGSVPSLQPRVGPSSAGTHPASALPSSVVPAAPATPAPAPAATAPIATAPAKDPLWVHVARGAWDVVSFCFGLAFVVTMSIVSLQSCIVTVPAGGTMPGPPQGSAAVVTDATRPRSESAHRVRPEPLPRLELVCGRPHGAWIEIVGCSLRVPLTGLAHSPADPCTGEPAAVTRRPRYSICWESFGDPVDVDPHAAAANPFDDETV
jgi:hypothetical protein